MHSPGRSRRCLCRSLSASQSPGTSFKCTLSDCVHPAAPNAPDRPQQTPPGASHCDNWRIRSPAPGPRQSAGEKSSGWSRICETSPITSAARVLQFTHTHPQLPRTRHRSLKRSRVKRTEVTGAGAALQEPQML